MKFLTGLILSLGVLLSSCGIDKSVNEVQNAIINIQDPTERGLVYIAVAIVMAAVIRGILND